MAAFDEEKFEEKYVHYFDELERAYSTAYQHLHGEYDSAVLRGIDRQVLSESEPVYEGGGEFRVDLPADVAVRLEALPGDRDTCEAVLDAYTDRIEHELQRTFGFEE